jgi:hypothetical protein
MALLLLLRLLLLPCWRLVSTAAALYLLGYAAVWMC